MQKYFSIRARRAQKSRKQEGNKTCDTVPLLCSRNKFDLYLKYQDLFVRFCFAKLFLCKACQNPNKY